MIFLPGIIVPAAVRFAPLLQQLDGVDAISKDLEVYTGGLHHLNTSHQAEPERTSALLRAHWARAEAGWLAGSGPGVHAAGAFTEAT